MRNVFKILLLATIVLISACESENRRSSGATGMLGVSLVASNDVISTTTRSDDEGADTEEDDLAPEVGDFKVALMNGSAVKNLWDKFSEYPKYAVLPVGTYTLKAFYGDPNVEGFEAPYYEGSQSVVIEDDATIDASITCYLTNVKMSVEYTDAFKKYFSDYSTTVQSAGGAPVVFIKEEVRAAYVKPGVITVYANVTKQDGKKAKLEVLTIDQAKSREFYKLKLDIDAGSSTLKISFDNTTVTEPVEINVSDDVLNMQPPFFTASGYVSGVVQEMKEGSTISPLSMLITARNGIKKCVLNTQSTSLASQGWPTSIDLVNPDAEILKKMKSLGLSMRGLSANVDKMATLDFSEVTSYLQHISGDDESTFSLVVTDKIGRVSDADEVIKVKALDNHFAVGTVENADLGVEEITIPVTLDGDISKVKFQYLKDDSWLNINVSNIATEAIQHKVKLALPFITTSNFQIKVICGPRSLLVPVGVNPPVFMLQASEADVWATKATIHVVGKNEGTTEYMKTQPVVIEYIKSADFETGNWITPEQIKDGDVITITGLPKDSEKTNIYKLKAKSGEIWSTNVLDITTEKAAQVPNAGFEDWNWNKTDKNGNAITKNLNLVYWKKWFPWAQDGSEQGWNTLNEKTTQDGASPSKFLGLPTPPYVGCCYVANSGTIPTSDCFSGSSAALVRTVGWGSGSAAAGTESKKGDAGYLYLGTLNKSSYTPQYGMKFSSRPSELTFYCKYKPKNPIDKFIAKIVVLDVNGNVISENQLSESECGENNSYTLKRIILDYSGNMDKKADKMYILFQSGTQVATGSTNYDYPPGANLSDGEFLGAQLYIDNVKLIY